jgi:ribosomal-protein-alanine N-acetyltransferase
LSGLAPELRGVATGDADALHAVFTEPGVRRYLFDDALLTKQDTRSHVEAMMAHGGRVISQAGKVVGFVSLRPVDGGRELMIAVSERCWGAGVAFAAAEAMMRHGFERLGLDRILASVDLPNERSHRLMLRLGFRMTDESDGPVYRLRRYEALRRSGT